MALPDFCRTGSRSRQQATHDGSFAYPPPDAEAQRRAAAFGRAFTGHITKLRATPHAYGELGLADLFEMREECLREFGFEDVYRHGG
jgi:hypothetical protein